MIIRKKENVLLEILTPLLVVFSIIIFIMVLKGKASTYIIIRCIIQFGL